MKKKNYLLNIFLGLIALVLVVLIAYNFGSGRKDTKDNSTVESTEKIEQEKATSIYPEIKDENGKNIDGEDKKYYGNLVQLTSIELLDNLDSKKEMILYVGRPTCPDCRLFLPIQSKVLKNLDKDIYYLNTDEEKTDNKRLTAMKKFLEKTGINEVPTIVKVSYTEKEINFEQAPVEVYTELSGEGLTNFLK